MSLVISLILLLILFSCNLEAQVVVFRFDFRKLIMPLTVDIVVDLWGGVFSSVVLIISSVVMGFSLEYIGKEKYFFRFHLTILSFIASIIILIFRLNATSVLIGWDGLGVTSYLLVIYFQRANSFNAGILTIISNRIGDVCLILFIFLLVSFQEGGFSSLNLIEGDTSVIAFVVFMGVITKRAQIPYSA